MQLRMFCADQGLPNDDQGSGSFGANGMSHLETGRVFAPGSLNHPQTPYDGGEEEGSARTVRLTECFLRAPCRTKDSAVITSVTAPILYLRKLRLKEAKGQVQHPTANRWQKQDLNLCISNSQTLPGSLAFCVLEDTVAFRAKDGFQGDWFQGEPP